MSGIRIVATAIKIQAAIGIKRGTDRRAERQRGKYCHFNPCDDLPGVCGTGKRASSKRNSAGDDKALAPPSNARPQSRIAADSHGVPTKPSDRR